MMNCHSTEVNDMNCFVCQKECVMRTEKHMDDTPCSVCVWGAEVAGEWCRDCLSMDSKCHFQELEQEVEV